MNLKEFREVLRKLNLHGVDLDHLRRCYERMDDHYKNARKALKDLRSSAFHDIFWGWFHVYRENARHYRHLIEIYIQTKGPALVSLLETLEKGDLEVRRLTLQEDIRHHHARANEEQRRLDQKGEKHTTFRDLELQHVAKYSAELTTLEDTP